MKTGTIRFNSLVKCADQVMYFKDIIKNVAKRNNKTVTFMPKPIFGDNGSGMHCHQSIWKGGKPLFHGDQYAGMSQMALHYIGGILKHAKVIAAFTNPTMNSYKRLTPGFEAPVNLAYSSRNRSASIRIQEALDNLEADHDFLMKGDVFTKDAIEMHINYKRTKEVDALRLRPHPYEFFLYYDI